MGENLARESIDALVGEYRKQLAEARGMSLLLAAELAVARARIAELELQAELAGWREKLGDL